MDQSLSHHWQKHLQGRLAPVALIKRCPFNRSAGPYLPPPHRTTPRLAAPLVTMQDMPTFYFCLNLSLPRKWHNNLHVSVPLLPPLSRRAAHRPSFPPAMLQDTLIS